MARLENHSPAPPPLEGIYALAGEPEQPGEGIYARVGELEPPHEPVPQPGEIDLERVDRDIERAVRLLELSREQPLEPGDRDKLKSLVGERGHDVVRQDLLRELRKAVAHAQQFDLDIKQVAQLLDKAETKGLIESERTRLFQLERSMRDAVASGMALKAGEPEQSVGPWSPAPATAGTALVKALRRRFLDRGTKLTEDILPRVRTQKAVTVPVLLRTGAEPGHETASAGQPAPRPVTRGGLTQATRELERALKLLEKSGTVPLNAGERRKLYLLVGPNNQTIGKDVLAELRGVANFGKTVDWQKDRAAELLEAWKQGSLGREGKRELSKLMDSNRDRAATIYARIVPQLGQLQETAGLSPEAKVLSRALQHQFNNRLEGLYARHTIALAQGVPMQCGNPDKGAWLDVSARGAVVALQQERPVDLKRFAQAARHPDVDRVIVLKDGEVRVSKTSGVPEDYDSKTVITRFRNAVEARYKPTWSGLAHLAALEQNREPLRVGDVHKLLSMTEHAQERQTGPESREPGSLHVLFVGGGPRTSTQVAAEIELLNQSKIRKDIDDIRALGGAYQLRTTIVEKRAEDTIGMGEAWNGDQEGTVNTGAEAWGVDNRLRKDYVDRKAEYRERMRAYPPALAMFEEAFADAGESGTTKSETQSAPAPASAFKAHQTEAQRPEREDPSGEAEPKQQAREPRVDRAVGIRCLLGEEEHAHFETKVREARQDPWLKQIYKLEILGETNVTAVDASPPIGASVTAVDAADDGEPIKIKADLVRMNTGTTLASPLTESQRDVAEHSYVGPMSRARLHAFLVGKQLLQQDGTMKPGTRVLTGGSGLSLYDQLLVLSPFMGLTEADPSSPTGWKITDYAKQNHQGAILITSNTDGKWISPRHSHTPAWTQNLKPISNSREQHALFLHNQGEEIYKAWQDICIASIAAATGKTPREVRQDGMDTDAVLRLQQEETKKHEQLPPKEKAWTMYGARRQAFLGTVLGMGLEPEPKDAIAALEKDAPLTYKGRAGYVMHRAQVKAITEPGTPVAGNNRALMAVHNDRFQDITSSPAVIHPLAKELIDAGIARYAPGSYSRISAAPGGSERPLDFEDEDGNASQHDFFLVSPLFRLTDNPAEKSLAGQVDPLDPKVPHIARVGQNRVVRDPRGVPLSIESYGLAGKGFPRSADSFLGVYAYDLNNRESAVQVAGGLAYRRLAEHHLAAAGRIDPVGDVERMYRELYPDEQAYREEVERFREDFELAMHKAALMRRAERNAGNEPAVFAVLYEYYKKYADTPERVRRWGNWAFQEEDKNIPEFKPASRDEYFGRFVDTPDHIHQSVYMWALREARMALGGRRTLAA